MKQEDMRSFNLRLPKEIWLFLKEQSMQKEMSMTGIIVQYIEKEKKKLDKT